MGNSNEKQAYIDEEGAVRSFNSKFVHCPQDEFFFISSCDVSLFQNEIEVEGGEDCYLVSVYWLNTWTRYVRSIGDNIVVGPINNIHLIDEKTRTLKKSVQYKTHFKTVSKAMWDYLFNAYGGGPVIGFRGLS